MADRVGYEADHYDRTMATCERRFSQVEPSHTEPVALIPPAGRTSGIAPVTTSDRLVPPKKLADVLR